MKIKVQPGHRDSEIYQKLFDNISTTVPYNNKTYTVTVTDEHLTKKDMKNESRDKIFIYLAKEHDTMQSKEKLVKEIVWSLRNEP